MLASLYNFAHWLTHNREEAKDLCAGSVPLKALKGFASPNRERTFDLNVPHCITNTFLTWRRRAENSEIAGLSSITNAEITDVKHPWKLSKR